MAKKNQLPTLAFQTYGSGSEILLAFHGYGQDHRVYEKFATDLGGRYTVYSFDLFLHGNNPGLSAKQTVTIKAWQETIADFLAHHNIACFSLVGYSLGARFALTLVALFAPQIQRLILIAPDGIKSNRWYQMASGTWVGHRLLRYTVIRPQLFFWILTKTLQLEMIEKSVVKFVEMHMNTRSKRFQVYTRWVVFRQIQPNLPEVIRACNSNQVRVDIFIGEYDSVVNTNAIIFFHKSLKSSFLHSLPCGHNGLIDEVGRHYVNCS